MEGSVEETGGATVYSWRERLILDFDPSNIEGTLLHVTPA